MNSKILQDKINEIESHEIEMRLLKKNESRSEMNSGEEKEKAGLQSNQPTVSLKHYDQLLCDLRCPGCTMRLQPPIYLCSSGHSVCRVCRLSLPECPICSRDMTDMRSYTLERLSGKFQFPCKNLRNGCNVRLPMELMKWHEEKCIYKKTSCFMGKIWHDCSWVGREPEWLEHCEEKHSQKILSKQDEYEIMWNYETLKDNSGPILAYYLIQNFGETFNLYQIYEAKHATLTWTVMLADYKETSLNKQLNPEMPRFSFEIEFFNKNDPRYLLIQRFPIHFEDSETLLDDGKCFKVSVKDIQRFLDEEKNLFYKVRIVSCKLRKDRWDELLDRARSRLSGNPNDSNFAFFDSIDSDDPFVDDFKSLPARYNSRERDDDLLRQIFQREFPDNADESTTLLQKPPRKSLENRSNPNLSAAKDHHTVKID